MFNMLSGRTRGGEGGEGGEEGEVEVEESHLDGGQWLESAMLN